MLVTYRNIHLKKGLRRSTLHWEICIKRFVKQETKLEPSTLQSLHKKLGITKPTIIQIRSANCCQCVFFKTDFESFCFLKEQKSTLNMLVCRKSLGKRFYLWSKMWEGAIEKTEDESQGKRISQNHKKNRLSILSHLKKGRIPNFPSDKGKSYSPKVIL